MAIDRHTKLGARTGKEQGSDSRGLTAAGSMGTGFVVCGSRKGPVLCKLLWILCDRLLSKWAAGKICRGGGSPL